MEIKSLIKGSAFLAMARLAEFASSLIRTKLSAVILGPAGIGAIGQLSFLTQSISRFTLLSMNEALVKIIAERSSDDDFPDCLRSAIKSYISLVVLFMLLSSTVLFVLQPWLTPYVFGDYEYAGLYYLALACFPLLVLDSVPFALMKAFKDLKSISFARIIITTANVLMAVPLIWFLRLDGAAIAVTMAYVTSLLTNYMFVKRLYFEKYGLSFITIIKAKHDSVMRKELIKFSKYGLTMGLYVIFSEFLCRAIVISNLGVDAIGVYSPIILWASLFTGFVLPVFTTYLYTRFCEVKIEKVSSLLNDGLRLGTLVLLPLLFLGIPYRNFFIEVFYTEEFVEAADYLPYHFMGVVFYVWFFVFSQSMSSTGRIRQHSTFRFFYLSLDIVVTYFFVQLYGIYGWMLKHIISPVIFFVVYTYYCKTKMGFSFSSENVVLMLYLFIGSCILVAVEVSTYVGRVWVYGLGPALLFASYFMLRGDEKRYIGERLSSCIQFTVK